MPKLGEIKRAEEIGYKGKHKRIWHACRQCGKELRLLRWENKQMGEILNGTRQQNKSS